MPASSLFLQKFGFRVVEQVDETEADEEIKIGSGEVDAAADLCGSTDPLIQADD